MKIDKETKIVLLQALKTGYLDDAVFLQLSKQYHSNLTDEELDKKISELELKIKKSNGKD